MARSDHISSLHLSSREGREKLQWFEANKSKFLAGGGVFFSLLIIVLLIMAYGRYQTRSALEDFRKGVAAFQDGKFDAAIPHLEQASARFGASHEGRVVRFYLGEAYTRSGKADEAKTTTAQLSPPSPEDGYLSQALLLTQGRSAEKQNDLPTARKSYEEAAALEGPFTMDALLSLARVSEVAGDAAAAAAAREKILASYPTAPLAEFIRQKLGK
jgi:tetratricopeptide (TPR) repeat protein